ncbi:hypothetical protein ACFVFQ_31815 [Streptomyces sp. NPDC057743]|uniref:hypothetical protein n=1 Tax=Streptomyces sp. NPDC057743 TaxID=3346236 RepID=UPI0036A15ED3
MIRIVTQAHLAGLEQAIEAARMRARQAEEAADQGAACYVRSLCALTARTVSAEDAAEAARTEAVDLHVALESARAELKAAHEMAAEQAQQMKMLEAELDTICGAVVLLHYGRLVSVHPTPEAARRHAHSLGAPDSGWRLASSKPASEVEWRTAPLADFAVEDGGGAG